MINLQPGERIERVLSAETGLSRQDLTLFRKGRLQRGDDWRYDREVILTQAGWSKVRRELLGEDPGDKEADPPFLEGQVTKWNFRNTRMVEVDGRILVRVKNAALWRPDRDGVRMVLRYVVSGDRCYQVGKAPRYPGKW